MKKLLTVLPIAILVVACNLEKQAERAADTDKVNDTTAAIANNSSGGSMTMSAADSEAQKVLGSFVGSFGDNKITLLITKIGGGAVTGRSIVGGNDRPFEGTFSLENSVYSIEAREPGDHKDDGVFKFTISGDDPSALSGTWKANDSKRPEKSYTLERRKFEYRANVGDYPQASTRLLKASDVENMVREELEFMRNEIFARHGYCFNKKHLRQQFENADWYVPNTVDIRGYLTDIEKKNIALIKRYEKYAEEYGDEYGR